MELLTIAIPRMNTQIFPTPSQCHILNPLCLQSTEINKYFEPNPPMPWNSAKANQCLADFQQSAAELAKSNGTPLHTIHFKNPMPTPKAIKTIAPDEDIAIMEFENTLNTTQKIHPAPTLNEKEYAQRTLILAWLQETQLNERIHLQRIVSEKDNALQNILHDKNEYQGEYKEIPPPLLHLPADDHSFLAPWQSVLTAAIAFLPLHHLLYINDPHMQHTIQVLQEQSPHTAQEEIKLPEWAESFTLYSCRTTLLFPKITENCPPYLTFIFPKS